MTPHISAKRGEIAKIVLMPGDPLRAKYIADNFLSDVKQVNGVRNMLMFTGKYEGREISICGSGMGQPSIGIYSYELFKFYNVENIIRIGSAGSYKKELKLYDVVLAKEAYSDSKSFNKLVAKIDSNVIQPSIHLNNKIKKIAKNQNIKIYETRVHSSDVFYSSYPLEKRIKESASDCVEMEATALFANAQFLGKNAACLLTISDNLITKEEISAKKRQSSFIDMIKVALELA